YGGWKQQQVVKIEAAARAPFDAVAFLDSDIFLCAPVTAAHFIADGKLRLIRTPAETYEDFSFEVGRQIVLSNDLSQRAEAYNYMHQPPRFLRRTAARLLEQLRATHSDWIKRFYQLDHPSEY